MKIKLTELEIKMLDKIESRENKELRYSRTTRSETATLNRLVKKGLVVWHPYPYPDAKWSIKGDSKDER